jgi:hypothetical protein
VTQHKSGACGMITYRVRGKRPYRLHAVVVTSTASNKHFRLPSVTRDGVGMTVHVGLLAYRCGVTDGRELERSTAVRQLLLAYERLCHRTIHGLRRGMARSRGSRRRWIQ